MKPNKHKLNNGKSIPRIIVWTIVGVLLLALLTIGIASYVQNRELYEVSLPMQERESATSVDVGKDVLLEEGSDSQVEGISSISVGDTIEDFTVSGIFVGHSVSELYGHTTSVSSLNISDVGEGFLVDFYGNTIVSGSVKSSFGELCFSVDEETGYKIPRLQGDNRIPWFCFDNYDNFLEEQLDALSDEESVTIEISGYSLIFVGAGVSDSTTLVRIIE